MHEVPAARFAASVRRHTVLAPQIFQLVLAPHPAMAAARPGQFVHILVSQALDPLLRRPFSICSVAPDGSWSVVYRVVGRGTRALSEVQEGAVLDCLGPLGRGFSLPEPGRVEKMVLVGGGLGVPPLVYLAQQLQAAGYTGVPLLGFAGRQAVICTDMFAKMALTPQIATDDGSMGHHGLVTDLLATVEPPAAVFACGPVRMLAAVARLCRERGFACQVSLEERMGCGVGACLSCVCPVTPPGARTVTWQRVCKEGPVFDAAEVAFDAML